ncbi:DUF3810 domain-containing protein [Cyclobacterium marinum]|uniref:Transmembrane zinc-binding protein n=1 Tax=Cyclobacterium marinum (strain ATCC 25205 / DSM 745 / LMG 13164 / NCIMB 1802) TaxID=880070 RepID=G0IZT6_CYCMS|nr:DUF3810 domain-containing protein [Cyclobacterium marinum]AEL25750.1 hypothetical protein Cycma_2003 [Cyclobacterium marinum DSM 745]
MKIGKWTGVYLGIISLMLRYLATSSPYLTEKWYTTGLYPLIRGLLDHTIVVLPFPTVYLLILLLIYLGYRFFRKLFKIKSHKQRFFLFSRLILNFLGCLIFSFLILWAYNYYRIPLYQKLNLNPSPLSIDLLIEEMETTQQFLHTLRENVHPDSTNWPDISDFTVQSTMIRDEMKSMLKDWQHGGKGSPVVKQFYPEATLRKLGIFGIYFPFTGEAYLDPSLHPLEKGFTMAHELAHGFGITDEGEANFMAWLVCSQSSKAFFQYAATMKLFRYQLNDLYRMDSERYKEFLVHIPEPIKNDIREIQESNRAIVPFASELSRRSNDLYLKSQGVKAGVRSYAQLPMLVYAWKGKQ